MENTDKLNKTESNGESRAIVAIIPAHNEVDRVGKVIGILIKMPIIDRVVVVDDGSSDDTGLAAMKSGADVIKLDKNRGKAAAMDEGVKGTHEPVILFLDADLQNLDENHINDLLKPVLENQADMTMGVFRNGRFRTDIAHFISPGLSGQRAILRHVWSLLDTSTPMEEIGYGIERELQNLVKDDKVTLKIVDMEGVSQFTKEEKLGPQKGFILRMKMYSDIVKTWTKRIKN